MANNIKLPEVTGNVNDLNAAFEKLTTTIGDSLKQAGKLNTQLSSVKKLTDLTKTQLDLEKKAVQIDKEKKNLAITSERLVNTKIKGQQESIRLEKEETKLKEQQIKTEKQALDLQVKERKENERLNKQKIQQNKNTKESIKQKLLEREAIRKTTEAARKELGLTKKRSGLFKSMTKSILASAAAFVSLRAAVMVVSKSFKTIAGFERGMAKVRAVTNATAGAFIALQTNAQKLGATTSKSASQVAGLQLEFSKLGFSTKEILAATEATIQLSIAAGSDLANSAVVAASTVRGFGLSADETQRVVDVMAKSFASSALDMEKFKTAMATAGPVAKSTGKTIEFTTAQLAVLSDAGLDASTAGTSLRNMFLELTKKGLTWEEGLEKINTSTNKAKTGLELFGKRGVTAGLILADNIDKSNKLEKSFLKSAGAAKRMADIMEDDIIGEADKFKSALEGLILSLNNGDGAISRISRGVIKLGTNILGLLTSTEKESEALSRLRIEMNANLEAIKNQELPLDVRNNLIEKVNIQYKDYLPNLIDEKTSLEDIESIQQDANKALLDNIRLKAQQEVLQEQIQKLTQTGIDIAEKQIQLEKLRAGEFKQIDQYNTLSSVIEQAERDLENLINDYENQSEELIKLQNIFDDLNPAIENNSELNNKNAGSIETEVRETVKLIDVKADLLDLLDKEKTLKQELSDLDDETEADILRQIELEKELADEISAIQDEAEAELGRANEQWQENEEEKTEILRKEEEKRQAIRDKFVETTAQLGNTLFELAQNQRETELSQIQANYDARILAAEGDTELQKRLALELENEQKRIAREQAVSKQNQALFNIGVDTAKNIVSVFPNIALMTLAAVVGGAQAAIVKSQPLPGFFTGTESAPAGLAYVAERGRELIERNGQMFMADKPQLFDFKGGETVYNNTETERMINGAIYRDIAVNGNQGVEDRIDKLTKAVMHKKENHFSWNERGFGNYVRTGSGITRYMQKKGRR
jgi:hypothetical protein